jgi:hypothetical protein
MNLNELKILFYESLKVGFFAFVVNTIFSQMLLIGDFGIGKVMLTTFVPSFFFAAILLTFLILNKHKLEAISISKKFVALLIMIISYFIYIVIDSIYIKFDNKILMEIYYITKNVSGTGQFVDKSTIEEIKTTPISLVTIYFSIFFGLIACFIAIFATRKK